MYPEKHLKDLESSVRRRKFLRHAGTVIIFMTFFTLLGPLIHETAHIVLLEAINCHYSLEAGFSATSGFHASIKPFCTPSNSFLLLFYSAGYISTFLAGSSLNLYASTGKQYASFTAAAGTGTLLSILLSIGSKGDISSFLAVLGSTGLENITVLFLAAIVFSLSFGGLKHLGD